MLEMFMIWLGTTVTSVGMSLITELGMMKDLSDAGYKFDMDALHKYKEKNNDSSLVYFIIPIVNVLHSFVNFLNYNNNRYLMLDQYRVLGLIERMNDEEIKEYEKNPTGLHAFGMMIKDTVKKKQEENSWVNLNVEGMGSIKFKHDDNRNIIVSEPTGKFVQLSKEQQEEYVKKELNKMVEAEFYNVVIKDSKNNTEEHMRVENKNKQQVQTNTIEEPIKTVEDPKPQEQESLSRSERIEELKKMREELVNDSKQEEKGFQKIKQ